jgi:hypothetical protein
LGRWLRKNMTNITYLTNSTKKIMKQLKIFKENKSLMHHFTWKTCKQKAMGITLHWYWELTHEKNKICRVVATFIHGRVAWWSFVHMNNLQNQNNIIHKMQSIFREPIWCDQ